MRAKSIAIVGVSLLTMVVAAVKADPLELAIQLNDSQVEALRPPIFTKEAITTPTAQFLFITRDCGSGLEVRDAFIFRRSEGMWGLQYYVRTSRPKLEAKLKGSSIEIRSDKGEIISTVRVSPLP